MAEPRRVYNVVKLFLLSHGYDAEKRQKEIVDGHMILYQLELALAGKCYTNENGACVLPAFDSLFGRMESGQYWLGEPLVPGESLWTQDFTNAALAAGGYPPKVDE